MTSKKRVVLFNTGNNVTNRMTVSGVEMMNIRGMLEAAGMEVDLLSLKADEKLEVMAFDDIDVNDYDVVLTVASNLNFFGGVNNEGSQKAYELMTKWPSERPIYVALTDSNVKFTQYWDAVQGRGWNIHKEDVWVDNEIRVISQNYDTDWVHDHQIGNFNQVKLVSFDWSKAFAHPYRFSELTDKINEDADVDLIYGGSFRSGSRLRKMNEYLFDMPDLDVEMFGSVKEAQFEKFRAKYPYSVVPRFAKKVKTTEMVNNLSRSVATVLIGDDAMNGVQPTARVYEAYMSNAVAFIDHEFWMDEFAVSSFQLVTDKAALRDKILLLKHNPVLREMIVSKQHEFIRNIDWTSIYRTISNILQ